MRRGSGTELSLADSHPLKKCHEINVTEVVTIMSGSLFIFSLYSPIINLSIDSACRLGSNQLGGILVRLGVLYLGPGTSKPGL